MKIVTIYLLVYISMFMLPSKQNNMFLISHFMSVYIRAYFSGGAIFRGHEKKK